MPLEKKSSEARWPESDVWTWYRSQPWLMGCNFLPSTAINQLDMFQPDDYDRNRAVLVRELDWAHGLGMNTLRIFLHDLLWTSDADGFFGRLDDFLDLCASRKIRPLMVFFDSCHRPEPRSGRQPEPVWGLHNPGWAQSPAVSYLMDERQWTRLEAYVKSVLRRHGGDDRILAWDLYNEPCHAGFDGIPEKASSCKKLVSEVFEWAREAAPCQPMTVGVWGHPDPTLDHNAEALSAFDRTVLDVQITALAQSDFVSFHNYAPKADLQAQIARLELFARPIFCTEYMARPQGSTFADALPILKNAGIAAYNWGFVSGKSQTIFPWGSPEGAPEPAVWFHDILRGDGSPFDPEEINLLLALSAQANGDSRQPGSQSATIS